MTNSENLSELIKISRYNYDEHGMVVLDGSAEIPRDAHAISCPYANYLFIVHGYLASWSMAYSNMASFFGPKGDGLKKYFYTVPEPKSEYYKLKEQPGGVFFLSYPTANKDFDFSPKEIAKAIDIRLREFARVDDENVRKIDVVAHSQGGMIMSGEILLNGGNDYIDHLVTLGSPLCGLPLEIFDIKVLGVSVADVVFKITNVDSLERNGYRADNSYLQEIADVKNKIDTKILKIAGIDGKTFTPTRYLTGVLDKIYGVNNHDGLIGVDSAHTFRNPFANEDTADPYKNCRKFNVNHMTILTDHEVLKAISTFLQPF